jgi:hypothetical protein
MPVIGYLSSRSPRASGGCVPPGAGRRRFRRRCSCVGGAERNIVHAMRSSPLEYFPPTHAPCTLLTVTYRVMRIHCPCLAIKQSIYLLAIVPKAVASSVLKIDVCSAIGDLTVVQHAMQGGKLGSGRKLWPNWLGFALPTRLAWRVAPSAGSAGSTSTWTKRTGRSALDKVEETRTRLSA